MDRLVTPRAVAISALGWRLHAGLENAHRSAKHHWPNGTVAATGCPLTTTRREDYNLITLASSCFGKSRYSLGIRKIASHCELDWIPSAS